MLTEVIVAIAIVATGFTALASSIPTTAVAVGEGAQLSTATFLAAARLEEVRGAVWSATPPLDRLGLSTSPLAAPQSGGTITFPDEASLPEPYGRYGRRVRIVDCGVPPGCGAGPSDAMRQITVTVTYRPVVATGMAAGDRAVSLATHVTRR